MAGPGRIKVVNRFAATEKKFERAALRAVDRASRDGVRAVRAAPTRYRIRGILAKTDIVPARVVGANILGGFRNPDFREIFFEYGTLMRRRKRLKRPRRRRVRRGGIHPQYPMTRGRRISMEKLPFYMERELAKVR
jgi:hypothetical protein